MNSKDFFFEFLGTVITIILILGGGYFLVTGGLEQMTVLMKILSPFAALSLLFFLRYLKGRKKVKQQGNTNITLYLTYWDKVKTDLISLLMPVLILLPPLILEINVSKTHLIQAVLGFIVFWLWAKWLFKKQ